MVLTIARGERLWAGNSAVDAWRAAADNRRTSEKRGRRKSGEATAVKQVYAKSRRGNSGRDKVDGAAYARFERRGGIALRARPAHREQRETLVLSAKGVPRAAREFMPYLIKFLLWNALIGFSAGLIAVFLCSLSRRWPIGTLIASSAERWAALGCLSLLFALSFGSVQMGIAIMLLPEADD
jgi:hypothetical protein